MCAAHYLARVVGFYKVAKTVFGISIIYRIQFSHPAPQKVISLNILKTLGFFFVATPLKNYMYVSDSICCSQLSLKCGDEVRRVMRQRAMSVELQPQVEYYCMNDLAHYCLKEQDPVKGEEMMCLQDHLER